MPRYYFQNDWFLFSVSCSSHLLPPASQVAAVAWSRRLEAHGMLWASPGAFCRSARAPGILQKHTRRAAKELRSEGEEVKLSHGAAAFLGLPRRAGRDVLAIDPADTSFLLLPQQIGCMMNTSPHTQLQPLQNILLTQMPIVWQLEEIWPSPIRRRCLEPCWCVIPLP